MECSVCEKVMFGHVTVAESAEVVCGSCALTSTAKGKKKPKTASIETMQVELFKESMKQPERSEVKEAVVEKMKVKSNYARNRVVVIGGNVVMTFNEDGECQIDAKHRPALEIHMRLRPNRFKIVEAVAPPVVEAEPVVEEVKEPEVVEEEAKEPEEVVAKEDKPAVEEAPKPKKAAKKKSKKKKSKKTSK